jgi:uroporphyrinogen-III synthase
MEDITTSEEEEYEGSDDSMSADYETDSEIERTQTNYAPPDNNKKELVQKLPLEGHQGPKVLVMLHEKGINMSAQTLTRRRLEWGL